MFRTRTLRSLIAFTLLASASLAQGQTTHRQRCVAGPEMAKAISLFDQPYYESSHALSVRVSLTDLDPQLLVTMELFADAECATPYLTSELRQDVLTSVTGRLSSKRLQRVVTLQHEEARRYYGTLTGLVQEGDRVTTTYPATIDPSHYAIWNGTLSGSFRLLPIVGSLIPVTWITDEDFVLQ